MKVKEIPWERIIHARGRATDYPSYLNSLQSSKESNIKIAFQELRRTLVHQGTLFPATPIVIPFLLEILFQDSAQTLEILTLFNDILDALLYQDMTNTIEINTLIENEILLSDKYLWNEYVSEREDEKNWELYNLPIDLINTLSLNAFINSKNLFQSLPPKGKKMSKIKNLNSKIIKKLDQLGNHK